MKCLNLFTAIFILLCVPIALSQVPKTLSYQGVLTDAGGNQIDGKVMLKFKLYDAPNGAGKMLWEESQEVEVTKGIFNAVLGSVTPMDLPFDMAYWLGISVDGGEEMAPRVQLTSSAYSMMARALPGVTVNDLGYVGIGTMTPEQMLHVAGNIKTNGTVYASAYSSNSPFIMEAPAGTERARIDDISGNFGIGTAAPAEKLDVAGTAQMTGFKLPTGAMSGYVLTSDGVGTGTWQQSSGGNGSTNHWNLTGNAGTTADNFLGTTDNQPLELRVNNQRIFRFELPNSSSPNIIGGFVGNKVTLTGVGLFGATISGGGNKGAVNWVTDNYGTIGGGAGNLAGRPTGSEITQAATYATIGGGQNNLASGLNSTIAGGADNEASGNNAAIGGGQWNLAERAYVTIAGGQMNEAIGVSTWASIGGGLRNKIANEEATISGGSDNQANGKWSTIGGGSGNVIIARYGTIAGGGRVESQNTFSANFVFDEHGTVGGGGWNAAGSIAGTKTDASFATVAGGRQNEAQALYSTIGGGSGNRVHGPYGTVGGGGNNQAGPDNNNFNVSYATVSGGENNEATGLHATIPGGHDNIASAGDSFAAGQMAEAKHGNSFVWNDGSLGVLTSRGFGTMTIRADGGVYFSVGGGEAWVEIYRKSVITGRTSEFRLIDTSFGAYLNGAGQWVNASDKNMKENLVAVDGQEVLDKLAGLSMSTWTHKNDPAVRHIGPMAQDFYGAFGMGGNDKAISTIDADGVALAAIQGLYQLVKQDNAELNKRIARLEAAIQNR